MARRHTPYYHKFLQLGAEIVDRIGFESAFKFTSIRDEHLATRERVGVYDVYYQGAVDIKGSDAERLLQGTLVRDVTQMHDEQVLYSSLVNESGGMIDDLTVFRFSAEHYWVCPTPSRVEIVSDWLTAHANDLCAYVTNIVSGTAYLSIQGPRSRETLASLTDADLSAAALPYYRFTRAVVAEVPCVVSRTGYSGELGFELFYPRDYGEHVWDIVLAAGADFGLIPCGLGALRSVRMEKKYPLYGLDLDETTSPFEANLAWTVAFEKGPFVGWDVLIRQRDEGVTRRLLGIAFEDLEFLAAPGDEVTLDGRGVGNITSADHGHFIGRSLALGYLSSDAAISGAEVTVTSKESGVSARGVVHDRALYDPEGSRVRG